MSQKHQIQIVRKETNKHLPPEVLQESVKRISSIYDKKGRKPLRPEEDVKLQRELISSVLGISTDADNFDEKVNQFWAEMSIRVESGGKVLDISKDKDGHPTHPEDYLKYMFAKAHKHVAMTRQDMVGDPYKEFYIRDPEREREAENNKVKARKKAYVEFTNIDSIEKANMVLRAMGIINPEEIDEVEKENRLEKLARTKPEKFYKAATDKNLEVRAEILDMINKGVLNRTNSGIYFMDDQLGSTMDEAIKFFKNKQNSETILVLRDKLKGAK